MKTTLTSGTAKRLPIERRYGLIVSNLTDVTIYLGDTSSVNASNGYPVPAGRSFQLPNRGFERNFSLPMVYAYQESGSDQDLFFDSSRAFPISAVTRYVIPAGPGINFYADSVNGDDGNDGLTPETAFQGLGALETAALAYGDGVSLGLLADSIWLEPLDFTGVTAPILARVGDTNPVLSGLRALTASGATQEDGVTYPNTWLLVDGSEVQASTLLYPGLYVTSTISGSGAFPVSSRFRRVGTTAQKTGEHKFYSVADKAAALAYVDANEGWFYYEYASSEHRYYFNSGVDPTGDARGYYVKKPEVILTAGSGGSFTGLTFLGTAGRNGVINDNNILRTWDSVIFRDGGIHTHLSGPAYKWTDCQSVVNVDEAATTYHLNSPVASDGAAYVRCKAFGSFALGRNDLAPGTAYYTHMTEIDAVALIDCESQGQGNFINYDSDVALTYVVGARVNDKVGDLSGLWPSLEGVPADNPWGTLGLPPPNSFFEGGLYYIGGATAIFPPEGSVVFYNERFVFRPGRSDGPAPDNVGVFLRSDNNTSVDLTFNYCTIVIDTYGADLQNAVNYYFFQAVGTVAGSVTFNNCILVLDRPNTGVGYRIKHPTSGANVDIDFVNCVFSETFSDIPGDADYEVSADIFETARGWRVNDWELSATSPAVTNDVGWRTDRASLYRAAAQSIANAL